MSNLNLIQYSMSILAQYATSVTHGYNTRFDRKPEGTCERRWKTESDLNQLQSTLPPLTTVKGDTLLKACEFDGYLLYMRDSSGSIFPIRADEEYHLTPEGRVRVKVPCRKRVDTVHDPKPARIAYALMFYRGHESIKRQKVLQLNVNSSFSAIYPVVREL